MAKDVTYLCRPAKEVQDWAQGAFGTKHSFWYESLAVNYMADHADRIAGVKPQRVWIELSLGDYEDRATGRVDLVVETEKKVWIVEVKYPVSQTEIFGSAEYYGAAEQVTDYLKRIENLGWWPKKQKEVLVVWIHEYPQKNAEFIEKNSIWPGVR